MKVAGETEVHVDVAKGESEHRRAGLLELKAEPSQSVWFQVSP